MTSALRKVLLWLALAGICWAGLSAFEQHHFDKGVKAEREAARQALQQQVQAETEDGAISQRWLAAENERLRALNTDLRKEIDHGPPVLVLAPRPAARAAQPAAAPGVDSAGSHADGGGACAGANQQEPAPAQQPGLRGLHLSAAAQRVWNSALAAEQLPAGACTPDDPASPACAADAGISIEDAWHNHTVNALSCAADRARFKELIEFLDRRDSRQGTAP